MRERGRAETRPLVWTASCTHVTRTTPAAFSFRRFTSIPHLRSPTSFPPYDGSAEQTGNPMAPSPSPSLQHPRIGRSWRRWRYPVVALAVSAVLVVSPLNVQAVADDRVPSADPTAEATADPTTTSEPTPSTDPTSEPTRAPSRRRAPTPRPPRLRRPRSRPATRDRATLLMSRPTSRATSPRTLDRRRPTIPERLRSTVVLAGRTCSRPEAAAPTRGRSTGSSGGRTARPSPPQG